MFPVEDGSKGRYNVLAEDVAELLADAEWTARYHESIALVAAAWGWDLERAAPIVPPQPVGQHRRLKSVHCTARVHFAPGCNPLSAALSHRCRLLLLTMIALCRARHGRSGTSVSPRLSALAGSLASAAT